MVIDILNARIKERGIPTSELARRSGLNAELLRRSLAGARKLGADEFVSLCHELDLNTSDFTGISPQSTARTN